MSQQITHHRGWMWYVSKMPDLSNVFFCYFFFCSIFLEKIKQRQKLVLKREQKRVSNRYRTRFSALNEMLSYYFKSSGKISNWNAFIFFIPFKSVLERVLHQRKSLISSINCLIHKFQATFHPNFIRMIPIILP